MKALSVRPPVQRVHLNKFVLREAASSLRRSLRLACKALSVAAIAALVLTAMVLPCRADSSPMTGTVTDALGRPLSGTGLQVRSANGATILHAVTENSGQFTIEL